MNEQLEFLKLITSRLAGAEIPYMLTGSMAMSAYAQPRMTRDIDVVIECGPSDAQRIAELFQADCYIDESHVREAIQSQRSFNIIHNEWIIKADFIVRKDSEYRRHEFSRRRKISMGDWDLWVASPEDLLLTKLQWSVNGASDVQRGDVLQLASSVRGMDWDYIRTWAAKLGLSAQVEGIAPND